MKTYIIHLAKLKDRKQRLGAMFKKYDFLEPHWIIQKDYYDEELLNKYYEYNKKEWIRKVRIANRPIVPYPLCKSQKHVLVNHQFAREKIAKQQDEYCLILEDDVKLCEGFEDKFKKVLKMLENVEWDLCFLEYAVKRKEFPKELQIVDDYGKYDCFCAGAYLIKKSVCEKMVNLNEKITLPNDDEQKYRVNLLGLKVWHVVPPLIEQTGVSEQSGQHQRDKQGIKFFLYWRFKIYQFLSPNIKKKIHNFEQDVKKILLGIK
jgi:GR25 family glycosyltransferase involved in LPS biosynthesis